MAELPTVKEEPKDIVAKARELPNPEGGFSLRPRNFDEAFRFANLIASSDLVPKDFRDKPANVLVAVQLGMELGVSPIQALQNIVVINGRPTIWGDLLPALIFSSGLLDSIDEQGDEKGARCTVKRKGFAPVTREFTWEDAKRAKTVEYGKAISLAEKSTYQSYPKRMMQMRARAFALRDMFADVLKGLQIREEVEDYIPEPRDVTEKPEPIKVPQPTKETTDDPGQRNNQAALADDHGDGAGNTQDAMGASAQPSSEVHEEETKPEQTQESHNNAEAKPAEESKEKSIKEVALAEVASYTADTFPPPKELNHYLKLLKGQDGNDLMIAYSEKKKELGL